MAVMLIDRAFELINNLDEPPDRRKFLPQWSTVVVSRQGEIIDVIRHREAPASQLHRKHMDMYPESVQFTATPGMYPTLESLVSKVEDCKWVGP
jgi:hypothetical protein